MFGFYGHYLGLEVQLWNLIDLNWQGGLKIYRGLCLYTTTLFGRPDGVLMGPELYTRIWELTSVNID